jgi:hypothetical protein
LILERWFLGWKKDLLFTSHFNHQIWLGKRSWLVVYRGDLITKDNF